MISDKILQLVLSFDGPVYDENQVAGFDDDNLEMSFSAKGVTLVAINKALKSKTPTSITVDVTFSQSLVDFFSFFFIYFI